MRKIRNEELFFPQLWLIGGDGSFQTETIYAKILTILNKLELYMGSLDPIYAVILSLLFSSSSFLNSKACLLHSAMEKKKRKL